MTLTEKAIAITSIALLALALFVASSFYDRLQGLRWPWEREPE